MAMESLEYDRESTYSGWLFFAGTVLGMAGLMRIIDGFWAFSYDGALPEDFEGALFGDDLAAYGWAHIIVGVILLLASFAVLTRSQIARWFGIVAGAIGAISAVWWMPYYPVWALTYVLLGTLVVYGLAAHGGREV